jgi:colanic acid/amylovoran biosynthesis protein
MGASVDTNNRGVSALAVSLVKLFRKVNPGSELSFILASRTSKPQEIVFPEQILRIPTIRCRHSFKSDPRDHIIILFLAALFVRCIPFKKTKRAISRFFPVLKEMMNADLIADIQGGDSFSDIYGLGRFFDNISLPILAILLKRRIVLLPQTYGPYNSRTSQIFARWIIKNAAKVYSRDRQGFAVIDELFSNRKKVTIEFSPDVAFMLDPINVEKPVVTPVLMKDNDFLIGMNINGLMYNGGYTKENMFGLKVDYKTLVKDIIELLLKRNVRILLIPHTFGAPENVNSDPYASKLVMEQFPGEKVHLLEGEYNQSELKGIISMCNFFIGSRMHACIGALSQGIPTLGIAYSGKFNGVFESIGIGELVIDCRKLDADSIKSSVLLQFDNRNEYCKQIKSKVDDAKEKIIAAFSDLLTI